jgi:hypothetical protein
MRVALALLLFASPALAYSEAVHAFITRQAFPDPGEALAPPAQADLDALRALFWKRAAASSAEFARRWPSPDRFDSFEFKQFLMLDPAARVHGFDLTPDEKAPLRRGELLARASRWPDDDERNRHRYLRDAKTHEIVDASDGTPMPYDPATLDFGSLTGTTSQGHAHYGLVAEPLSDDPEVLKKEPWRFAVPKTAHAYGAEFVDIYSDLAALSPSPWLRITFEGAAFHHLEDLCNQIHTVQVGIYEFFQSAFIQSKLRDVMVLGGLFGRRYSLKDVGLRLIANHHLLSEDLFARHLGELRLDLSEDPEISGAASIIARSSREAPEVYRLAWQYSAKTLRDGIDGHEYVDGKDDPDAYVDWSQKDAVEKFYSLQERGVRRAVTALRKFKAGEHDPTAMLIAYHEQAAQRRAQYQPATAERLSIAWGYPAAAAALLALVAAGIWSRLSKRS